MTTIATLVARVAGGAHCQPIASWAHIAAAKVTNTAQAQASVASPARAAVDGSSGWTVSPAALSRASRPLRATSPLRRRSRGRSARSAMSSSVNSAPYRARQLAGYQRSIR